MKTIGEVLGLASGYLKEHGLEKARRDVEEMIASLLKCKRIDLYLRFDQPLEEKELIALREFTKRRIKGEPLEYILGEVEFFGAKIGLNASVLIPRQETEILAATIAERYCEGIGEVWDLCCGSGAVGISLKKKFPAITVFLSDIREDVVQLAKKNASKNQAEVEVLLGDLFQPFVGRQADLIVCNPPYISETEYTSLDASVRDFEPKIALVGGSDGLEIYRRLAKEAPSFLKPGGKLCLEIGHTQGDAVIKIFSQSPWKKGILEKDWSGKDRFFFLETE